MTQGAGTRLTPRSAMSTSEANTFRKYTSTKPVDDYSDARTRFFLTGAALVVGGAGALLSGGDDGGMLDRLLGLLLAGVGVVLLEGERRDYRRWRYAVQTERNKR